MYKFTVIRKNFIIYGGCDMNSTELKTHFYKRFNSEGSTLVFKQIGMPVSLMGRLNFDGMPSIACRLSMRIRVVGCKTAGNSITVTSTKTDMRRVYELNGADSRDRISHFIKRAKGLKLCGGDLLVDSTIPPVFDPHITYTAAVCSTIMELAGNDAPPAEICAEMCALKDEYASYAAAFGADKGYSVYTDGLKYMRLPLPMTGYRFIIAAVKEPPGLLSGKNIIKTYNALKKLYPHITSFSDINDDMLTTASPLLKSYSAKTCARYLVSECERTKEAAAMLKICNIKKFADIMNSSFLAQKHLCTDNDPRVFLCDELYSKPGIIGARICERGIIAIAEEDVCDSAAASASADYEAEFGYPPVFCIADSI